MRRLRSCGVRSSLPIRRDENLFADMTTSIADMGHVAFTVRSFQRAMMGRGQVIQKIVDRETGATVWAAGSDLRADGHAAAQI